MSRDRAKPGSCNSSGTSMMRVGQHSSPTCESSVANGKKDRAGLPASGLVGCAAITVLVWMKLIPRRGCLDRQQEEM